MNSVLKMISGMAGEFEAFCFNFTKGVSCNISVVRQLIDNEEEEQEAPPQEPAPLTELAKRRAEKRRKLGLREEPPKKQEIKTVRGTLWMMIKSNFFFSVLMLLGMHTVIVPALNWVCGGVLWLLSLFAGWMVSSNADWPAYQLAKNPALEMMVSRLMLIAWMIPIMLISKVSNIFWMNDLSSLVYKKTMGKPVQTGLALFISDVVYTITFQIFFFIQVYLSTFIPLRIKGINVLELSLTAITYSMYAFEYKWMNMGFGVQKRLDLIETNFGFHFGFGLPLAFAIIYFENFWFGVTLNSILFPTLILSASYAAEPREIRGRKTHIFYPTEKVVAWFFSVLFKMGLKSTLCIMFLLALVAMLLWLGLLTVLVDFLPHQAWLPSLW
ncbi:ectopic P granules protein 4-like [Babylonia areolata]|uniref:ectopic P granules protein 4-like n=1 Tax=Babylonia areolata TaxID=304850 RepID=UPI003FD38D1C